MLDKKVSKRTALAMTLGSLIITAAMGFFIICVLWWNRVNVNWGPKF